MSGTRTRLSSILLSPGCPCTNLLFSKHSGCICLHHSRLQLQCQIKGQCCAHKFSSDSHPAVDQMARESSVPTADPLHACVALRCSLRLAAVSFLWHPGGRSRLQLLISPSHTETPALESPAPNMLITTVSLSVNIALLQQQRPTRQYRLDQSPAVRMAFFSTC